jgi:hypothetical protein
MFCDECGVALNPNDDSIFYGGGTYCAEHHPDPNGERCGECGAHPERYEAPDDAASLALRLIDKGAAGGPDALLKEITEISDADLRAAADYMVMLSSAAGATARAANMELGERAYQAKIDKAAELGALAHAHGNKRYPHADPSLVSLLGQSPANSKEIREAFQAGWDNANLAKITG